MTIQEKWATAFPRSFGPSTNPEAWTLETFQKIYGWMNPNGILSTYGAAGHARRSMASAGFWTASTKGFGRKREMTIASLNAERLSHGHLILKVSPIYGATMTRIAVVDVGLAGSQLDTLVIKVWF